MRGRLKDESGTTLVELMVGLAAGMIVLAALSLVMIMTVRSTARVSARVDATQRARVVVTQIAEQLHSACIEPQMAPILAESDRTELAFVHSTTASVAAVAPTPLKSVIRLEGENLTQEDVPWASGVSPSWVWNTAGATKRTLLTKVTPATVGGPVFAYDVYTNGTLESFTPTTALGTTTAAKTVQVRIALNALPASKPVKDEGADATIQDSAVFRLTPPSFSESAPALPCQ